MNNEEIKGNKDALLIGEGIAESPEDSQAPPSKESSDALDELSNEENKSAEEIKEEYLSRFRSYEERVIKNERATVGGRIGNHTIKSGNKASRFFKTLLLIICSVAFVVSGFIIVERIVNYYETKNNDTQIKDLTLSDSDLPSIDPSTREFLRAMISKYPQLEGVDFPPGFNYKYALLYAANKDFVGYLKIPGTKINTAVLQHSDDDFYFDHDFYGKESKYGAVFASAKNNMVNLDQNTVLIGHHMNDGSRFHDLKYYRTQEGYKKSPVIEFNTAYGDYKWKVYGAFIINAKPEDDNGYILNCLFNNISLESFEKYIAEIDKRTLYKTGVDLLPFDKILTLMTCTYEFDDARLVVIARMLREGESAQVDLSLVTNKSSPIKYPQALYDKRGKTSPYANDEKWYPEQ